MPGPVFVSSSDVFVSVEAMFNNTSAISLLVVAALALASCGDPDVRVDFDPTDGSVLERTPVGAAAISAIEELVNNPSVPSLAWSVVQDGVVSSGASGDADVELRRPADADTAYSLGSVSKPVLAVVVMSLVEEGLLDLDTDVNQYLDIDIAHPWNDEEPITLRSLMLHTSGIIDNNEVYESQYRFDGDHPMPLADFMASYLVEGGAFYDPIQNFSPERSFAYSNIGAGLVGYVVERVAGNDLHVVADERVFIPLEMTNTGWHLDSFPDLDNVATPYTASPVGVEAIGHVGFPTYPDGGLRSSANDLGRLAGMVANGGSFDGVTVLSPAAVDAMIHGGFFWTEVGSFRGHSGFDPGAQAQIVVDRQRGVGVVVLVNSDAVAASDAMEQAQSILLEDAGYAADAATPPEGNELEAGLEALIADQPGGVTVGVFSGDDVVAAAAGELAVDAVIPLPGLTTTMLSVLALQQAEAGLLDLDQPIHEVVGTDVAWTALIDASTSLRDLLSHQPGLGFPLQNAGPGASITSLLETVDGSVQREPGRFSHTHNLIAALTLETATGESVSSLLDSGIFAPAGIGSAAFATSAADVAGVPGGWLPGAAGEPVTSGEFGDGVSLAGTVLISATDAVAFVQALYSGLLLDDVSTTLDDMMPELGTAAWGFGMQDLTNEVGSQALGVLGDLPGYQSFLAWTIDGGVVVAVAANSEFIDLGALLDELLD